MSEALLEACRRALATDPQILGFVGTNNQNARVYPSYAAARQAMDAGKFPLITFSVIGNRRTRPPRKDTNLQIEIVGPVNGKRLLWQIEKVITDSHTCFQPSNINAKAKQDFSVVGDTNPPVDVTVAKLDLVATEDNVYDVETNTHRIRLQYAVKWHTDEPCDPSGLNPNGT